MDYYKTLGVPKNAPKDEIKRAYRKLAHKYHPDKRGGDEKKFKEINEAYQVLGDDKKKIQYDQFGSSFGGQGGGGFSAQGGPASGWDFSRGGFSAEGVDFGDIFSEFFGGGGARTSARTKQKGRDIRVDMEITLEDAFSGVSREISLKKNVVCSRCDGDKNEPGTHAKTCESCNGSGEIRQIHRTILGSIAQVVECAKCSGGGKIQEKKCSQCRGSGFVRDTERISVNIPAGIHSGESIVFSGKGEAGAGGYGNLYVGIHIKEHPYFNRESDDIYSNFEISISQAVLGDFLKIKTLHGETELKIPTGIESGAMIKLQGKGMPRLHGAGQGDHYVKVSVKTPQKLSKRAKDLFEEIKKEGL